MSEPASRADSGAIPMPWWRSGVLYQVYPRSFADSDGDGHGDLRGVIDHLDHLEWLGVDGIWLNPVHPSPNADWGYDVADYLSVAPDLGDLDTLDLLVARAAERGIRVLLDLVPNHTSDRHPWFVDARSSRDAAHRAWYVWADPAPGGGPPNNWRSVFGGPAWTWDEGTGQYYLHNFLPQQPDLDWWNPEVARAFDEVLRFWFERGVAGFRIDVAHGLVKDVGLRDNPPTDDSDHPRIRSLEMRPVFNMNRDEVHDVFRRWRSIADAYRPSRLLLGETWVLDLAELVRFYGGDDDELHLALNFPFVFSELGSPMRSVVDATERALPATAWPAWFGSNHDAGRFPTIWCDGDDRRIRAALMVLMTLRGTPILYYGDEIGMTQVEVPPERLRDPVGTRGWPDEPGRDVARTPMQWTSERHGGFTADEVEPWLPMGDTGSRNVADQRADPSSILHLCRDLIALRRRRPDLAAGAYSPIDAAEPAWAWRRGDGTIVAVNCSSEPADVVLGSGTVLVGTDRGRDGERVEGRVALHPWEGVVVSMEEAGG